jgi:hypothetical protein
MADVTWLDVVTAAVALSSLVLSVYLFIKQQWEKREASVGAHLERFEGDHSIRLVIANHGPHVADDVDAVLQGRGREEPRGLVHVQHAKEMNDLPIPRLHAGEAYYIFGFFQVLSAEPAQAVLTWRDGRRGVQRKTVQLSVRPK